MKETPQTASTIPIPAPQIPASATVDEIAPTREELEDFSDESYYSGLGATQGERSQSQAVAVDDSGTNSKSFDDVGREIVYE
jgi:hypothetical protein